MAKNLIKNLSFFIGGILLLATGLIYVLVTDLYLSNSSQYLLLGILLAFGGSISFLLSNNLKHKIKWFYALKGIGVLLSIGFIIFLFLFMNAKDSEGVVLYLKETSLKLFKTYEGKTVSFLSSKFQNSMAIRCSIKGIYVTNIVLAILAVILQSANVTYHAIYGVEE